MAIISIENEEVRDSERSCLFRQLTFRDDILQIVTKPTDATINGVKSSNQALLQQVTAVRFPRQI